MGILTGYLRHARILLAILVVGLLLACGDETENAREAEGKLPVTPGAINELPTDTQRLPVTIVNGAFDAERYAAQPGAIRLNVTTVGGPYTLSIGDLVPATELPANATTEVEFTAPEPGEHPMRLTGPAEATALLNIRPVGGR